jgi:ATP-dependent Lhr-like helicase
MSKFNDLDPIVQKWVYKQGWEGLREIQEKSINPILSHNTDVVISASTASGKTEAFFMPALTKSVGQEEGFCIVYVSPLKALINDQYRRLEDLAEMMKMEVTPWHGDSSKSQKRKMKKNPSGILLITPESLEAMLINDAGWAKKAFSNTNYFVIDEFHAFIGSVRGQQLLSLMNRIEILIGGKKIPRIALSATLGDLGSVAESLRFNSDFPCVLIASQKSQSTLMLQVRGYMDPINVQPTELILPADEEISKDLYEICRGTSNLVFANSRNRTEMIAANLSDLCDDDVVPNEFFPHHGSLSKDQRESLESRLQKENLPTTAVCTMTLELGIDIGKVDAVGQISAPKSVSGLRQRLGRSGRRDDAAVLRMFIAEQELSIDSNIISMLRLDLLQSIAMVNLLISSKWFEPADTKQFHFSTLFHQILAVVAQWGGVQASQLFNTLCVNGPFNNVSVDQFKVLLKHMSKNEQITQLGSGEIVLGIDGERLVNQYTFFSVFKTPEEYRLVAKGKTIGTLPSEFILMVGMKIIFGGKRWVIKDIDVDKKVIYVKRTKGGSAPKFGGDSMAIHSKIREVMYNVYKQGDYRIINGNNKIDFLDSHAKDLFEEGLKYFNEFELEKNWIVEKGNHANLIPWTGDKVINTMVILLIRGGYTANSYAGVIEVEGASESDVIMHFKKIIDNELPTNAELASSLEEKCVEKFDEFLPMELLNEGYGQRTFDIKSTAEWLKQNLDRGIKDE